MAKEPGFAFALTIDDAAGTPRILSNDFSSLSLAFHRPTFKEFVVRVKNRSVDDLIEKARREGIFAGVPLGRWYPQLADCLLVAVTEKRTKEEIDRLAVVCS